MIEYQLDCGLWRTAEGLASRNDTDFKALYEYPILLNVDFPNRYLNIVHKFEDEVEITANFKSGNRIPFKKFSIIDYLLFNGCKRYIYHDKLKSMCGSFDLSICKHIEHDISRDDIVTSFDVAIGGTKRVEEVFYPTELQKPEAYEYIRLDIQWVNNEFKAIRRVYVDPFTKKRMA